MNPSPLEIPNKSNKVSFNVHCSLLYWRLTADWDVLPRRVPAFPRIVVPVRIMPFIARLKSPFSTGAVVKAFAGCCRYCCRKSSWRYRRRPAPRRAGSAHHRAGLSDRHFGVTAGFIFYSADSSEIYSLARRSVKMISRAPYPANILGTNSAFVLVGY